MLLVFWSNAIASNNLSCNNISFSACIDQLSTHYKIKIISSANTQTKITGIVFSGTNLNNDLSLLLNSLGLEKFVITKQESSNSIIISIFSDTSEINTGSFNQDNQPKQTTNTFSEQNNFPSLDEIEAQKEKNKSPQPIDLDAKISIPGFSESDEMTLRQIRSNQERYSPKSDDLVIPGFSKEENTTYEELESIRRQINTAPDLDKPFTMPDGSVVIPREIREADKINKPKTQKLPEDSEQ